MIRRHRLRLPSPALAISLVALFVALGGTSYALTSLPANSVGSKQLKKNAVTTKKIKSHAVTAAKINPAGLTVPSANHANSANVAAIGESPVAWAEVGAAGGVAGGRGITGSDLKEVGAHYCFKGLPSGIKTATVMPDYGVDETPGVGAGVAIPASDTGDCPAGSQAEVTTWLGTSLNSQSFFVSFYN